MMGRIGKGVARMMMAAAALIGIHTPTQTIQSTAKSVDLATPGFKSTAIKSYGHTMVGASKGRRAKAKRQRRIALAGRKRNTKTRRIRSR
jgi:predicted Co/Zn/Cd cation transporter (cation efflux family)